MRLRRLEPVVRRAFRGPCAAFRGGRVLVAASGGADSTALLVTLARLAPELGLDLHAAHLDHGLRGDASRADRAFVAALCRRLEVPLTSARWDTRARMRRRGLTGQEGLRRLRREFLLAAARRAGAVAVATGHTADDQLETMLMRLARGAGLQGLGGIAPRRGRWIRPLLEASRHEVEADLRQAGLAWREDPSNDDPKSLRSRLRRGAIPALLDAVAPSSDARARAGRARAALARKVARSAREARGAAAVVDRVVVRVLSRSVRIQAGEIALDSAKWRSYPYAIRRRLLRHVWIGLGRVPESLTQAHLQAVEALATSVSGGGRVALPGGRVAYRDGGALIFRVGTPTPPRRIDPFRVPTGRRFRIAGVRGGWTSGMTARRRLRHEPLAREYFAVEALEGPLELRPGSVDETFVPFGRLRARRLGEFLVKQRVSRTARSRPLVLADRGGILSVIGVRRSARAPLTTGTRQALWIHSEPHDR